MTSADFVRGFLGLLPEPNHDPKSVTLLAGIADTSKDGYVQGFSFAKKNSMYNKRINMTLQIFCSTGSFPSQNFRPLKDFSVYLMLCILLHFSCLILRAQVL